MKRVEEIRQKRSNTYIMERLRKGREVEWQKDVREVQRDISLIRSPAAGLKQRLAEEEASIMEVEPETIEVIDSEGRKQVISTPVMVPATVVAMEAEEVVL